MSLCRLLFKSGMKKKYLDYTYIYWPFWTLKQIINGSPSLGEVGEEPDHCVSDDELWCVGLATSQWRTQNVGDDVAAHTLQPLRHI